MNATTFFNAIKLAKKPAAIGFISILGLGVFTAFAIALSTLLAILIPILVITSKVAIFAYPLFISGLIAIKTQSQKKEPFVIQLLPPSEPRISETILNDVIVTLPPAETFFDFYLKNHQPTWQQQILSEIQLESTENQPITETQDLQPTEDLSSTDEGTGTSRDNPFNQLTITRICWQAFSQTATLLESIKASEMKSIAADLKISKYRNMNKTQLLLEILQAYDEIPVFSE